ncbi:CD1375 family protein [Lactobacillus acetotolerans]|uniref:CD1375 family protein n=1 Tax=Lactobacillus acetotolerans TaxID=1600 RepID=UPI002FD8F5E2
MTKLNNATNVLFSALILNGKASIDDVPEKLRDGVQAELDFFNDIGIADDNQTQVENKSNLSNVDTPASVAPKTDNSNSNRTQNDATDQALAEVNDAVKDAEK